MEYINVILITKTECSIQNDANKQLVLVVVIIFICVGLHDLKKLKKKIEKKNMYI